MFSLCNNDDLAPFKAPLRDENDGWTIYHNTDVGPSFGWVDLVIANNAESNTGSYTDFGLTYQPPPGYTWGKTNTSSLLVGSYKSFRQKLKYYI